MDAPEALKEFKAGLEFLNNNYVRKALACFTRAVELEPKNPFYLSYQGLALAAAEQNWDEAEEICLAAVRMKRTQAELYLNLAHLYHLAGKKEEAVDALKTGIQLTKRDPRLVEMLQKFGSRRTAVLSFLPRAHFLNRGLGKIRARLLEVAGKRA